MEMDNNFYSKQWVVGYFAPENTYSVVPIKWIIFCGKMSLCKWPNKGNVLSMIVELFEPKTDWPTYPITIVSQYFDDYTKTLKKEKELLISASESEITPPRRKRKNKRNVSIDNFNAENSNDSHLQTPIKISKIITAIKTINFSYENDSLMELGPQNNVNDMSQSLIVATEESINNKMDIQQCSYSFDNYSYVPLDIDKLNTKENLTEMFKKILELQMTTLEVVKRMSSKLELIDSKVNGNPLDNTYNDKFMVLFPFKNKECIDVTEKRLLNDENFERQLNNYINQVGGTSLKNFIKRIFTKLFTNELATSYS